MMNGAEEPAIGQPDHRVAPPTTLPSAPASQAYQQHRDPGLPKLDRGIVWSDLVLEMEEEHAARLARAAEKITPIRPGRIESGDPADGLEEAA